MNLVVWTKIDIVIFVVLLLDILGYLTNLVHLYVSGRISNVKSISSTHSTVSSLPSSSSIRDLTTTNRSSAGGGASTATSMHLSTSKQEPLTSIVVIKTEAGSINSGNLIGVSDEVIL